MENTHFYVLAAVNDLDKLALAKDAVKRLPTVTDVETNIWMGIRNIPENLQVLSNPKGGLPKRVNIKKPGPLPDIDDLDRQIIQSLSVDSRKPFNALAEELDSSTSTVIRKYTKLRDLGLINCSIQIDPLKVGYRAAVIFDVAFFSKSSLSSVVDKLSEIPDVYLIIETSGVYDLSIFSMITDVEQVFKLRDEISEIADVSKMHMFLRHPKKCHPGITEQITTF